MCLSKIWLLFEVCLRDDSVLLVSASKLGCSCSLFWLLFVSLSLCWVVFFFVFEVEVLFWCMSKGVYFCCYYLSCFPILVSKLGVFLGVQIVVFLLFVSKLGMPFVG